MTKTEVRMSILVACLIFLTSTYTFAQDQFKVGDRVQVLPFGSDVPENWQPCTVIMPLQGNAYGVRCDAKVAGGTPQELRVTPQRVKAFAAGDARAANPVAAGPTQKKNEAADKTVLADRAFANCDIQQIKAKNGNTIPDQLAKQLIQCIWEMPAKPGMDGAITVDVESVEVGAPRKWIYRRDLGQGIADLDTMVWPVDVKYTTKTFFRSRTHVSVKEDIFNCYINSFAKWSCGLSATVKVISEKDVPVQ